MNKRLFLSAAIFCGILGAYLGAVFSVQKSPSTNNQSDETHSPLAHIKTDNSPKTPIIKPASITQNKNVDDSLRAALLRAIGEHNAFSKEVSIYRALANTNEVALLRLIASIDNFPSISADDKSLLLVMLLSRLAEVSPEQSIEISSAYEGHLEPPLSKKLLLRSIYTIWAKDKPQDMLNYLLSQPQDSSDYYSLLFMHWATQDFSKAWGAANALEHHFLNALYGLVSASHTPTQFRLLQTSVFAQNDVELKTLYFRSWAASDVLSAAQWLAGNTRRDEATKQKHNIFSRLVSEDFIFAIQWYFENTDDNPSSPQFSYSNFYDFIAPEQYVRVFDWLLSQYSTNRYLNTQWFSRLEYNLALNAVEHDVDLVRRYVIQLPDFTGKRHLAIVVYKALAQYDTSNADMFLKEADLADDADFVLRSTAIKEDLKTPCVGLC